MTDASLKQSRFMVNQLRMKNIWKELELLSVIVTIIFVSSLLPSLLLRYVYTDPQMMVTPPIFDIIPVFSFVLVVAMFIYVAVGNIMREMKATALEKSWEMSAVPTNSNSTDLQAAMKNLSDRSRTKVVAAQRVTSRSTKARKGSSKRKNK